MNREYNQAFQYYQIGVYDKVDKLYAIGDIHGDFNAFITVLKSAKIVDDDLHWIAGNSHVVQVGDILDRKCREDDCSDEDSEFKIIGLILHLQKEAYLNGGGFHPIIGNHELMNILGIFDYVSPMGLNHFGGIEGREYYFKIGGDFCKYLACGWNPIVKIGDFIFCHGGISSTISKKYSIEDINLFMRDTLYGNKKNIEKPMFNELFLAEHSILWNRTYSTDLSGEKEKNAEKQLTDVLTRYGAKYMVLGHTPHEDGIRLRFNNRVICIDTGMSDAFGLKKMNMDRIHFLEVIDNKEKNKNTIIIR
jgi:hypothetical protein